jgi:hypothetical protein
MWSAPIPIAMTLGHQLQTTGSLIVSSAGTSDSAADCVEFTWDSKTRRTRRSCGASRRANGSPDSRTHIKRGESTTMPTRFGNRAEILLILDNTTRAVADEQLLWGIHNFSYSI